LEHRGESPDRGGRVVRGRCCTWARSTIAGMAWRKSIAILEEGALQPRTLSLFPEDRCEGLLPDASIVRLRLNELRLCRPAPVGRMLVGAELVARA